MTASLRIAVIADGACVPRFGRDALDTLGDVEELVLFSCTNSRGRRNAVRHGAYYALNLVTIRNAWTRQIPLAEGRHPIARTVPFESGWDGAWQTLPPGIVAELSGFDVVVKLGMGLLRIPPRDALPVPILSWHHGDPDRYRGRPAGFWEMWERAPRMGQIVQILGNRLDAGHVVAFAETRVVLHSYRATLAEAYAHSRLLLKPAIRNALAGTPLPKPCTGRNYRLPSNLIVARFVLRMALRWLGRVGYGLFVEKKWQVSHAELAEDALPEVPAGRTFPPPERWQTLPTVRRYSFYADPFFCDQGILVEALDRRSGTGEILLVGDGGERRVSPPGGHFSYPATIRLRDGEVVVPEIGTWSPPRAYRLEAETMREVAALEVEGAAGLLDPTLVEHEGRLYLFATPENEPGANVLRLWSAEALDRPFREHPASPVRISPRGGRMAGAILDAGGRRFRIGQNFERSYGDGIVLFEIEALGPDTYREREAGALNFADRRGPHTLNHRGGRLLFDWYVERFAPLAGARRLLALLRSRRT